jgi:hypothetical protein
MKTIAKGTNDSGTMARKYEDLGIGVCRKLTPSTLLLNGSTRAADLEMKRRALIPGV